MTPRDVLHGADAPRGFVADGEWPAGRAAQTALRALLPEDWRAQALVLVQPGRLAVRFGARGRRQGFELQRAQPASERLVFRYRPLDAPDSAVAERCRTLFGDWARRASEVLPWLPAADARPSGLFLDERALALESAGDAGRRAALLESRLSEALPPGIPGRVDVYLDSPCAQRCEFCHVAHEPASEAGDAALAPALLDEVLARLAARHPVPVLNLSGGDWLRHPAREALLGRLEREREVPVSLQGPSTGLADEALAARVAALPTLTHVLLTLEAADDVHDDLVATPGAGAAVRRAIDLLRTRAPLRLQTVLTRRALEALPATLAWLDERRLFTALLAFLPDRLPGWDSAPLLPRMDEVRRVLEAAGPLALRTVGALSGLPPCAVPPALRGRSRPAASAPQREALGHAPLCGMCSQRSACPGVPAPWLRAHPDGAGLVAP
jgi:pyruvate-formate lyase-activating enzyme